ncbi:3-hydroxy-3-methylglutaryl-coenzyme A reductase 1-like [Cryptomeria japonica]|uniref:3-hydroxy-3-methylglutaryl-coenzyme A reductase 1-like n=1 Tax=Cryptomeria japonica TaxID=3369 RepID=UPI0025AC78D6|nr:3-hydroxy-3-methylglutaryl-coenzyme A reductase 1-like [Cryptomeria japonica]
MDLAGLRKSKMVVRNGGETDCCGDFKMMKKRDDDSVKRKNNNGNSKVLASDALLLPLGLTNKLFFLVFFASSYFLMKRWREKMVTSTPLHVVNFGELVAIVAHLASFIYLLGFFGIDYVQNFINGNDDFVEKVDLSIPPTTCGIQGREEIVVKKPEVQLKGNTLGENEDGDIAAAVCNGTVASYSLESSLGDCKRAASVRRRALEIMTGRSLDGLPLEGFDYQSILGQCCEMPVGYVQIPVGVAGPLLVNGLEYMVPMATTEGCLVASTNRGCKAILMSGGATSILLRDGMTRAPVVRFQSAKRASELKFYIEDPANADNLSDIFNRTSRFARLQGIKCAIAGKNLYMRFSCFTGDAMGMNMVSKAVQNVLDYLQITFPDMDVISVSGNFCADKKPTAVNWIEGRGKSVVCEAIITEAVVNKVLKTTVPALLELNMLKNLTGSAMAGAMGGFNAHAANIVSAVFIATGQDPAQNVESSHCLTMMEGVNGGKDLHISVSVPCIEVGTVGGGTQLASQAACLNMVGVKGANGASPGANAQNLARVVAAAVMAGELSLMSALAAGQLVKSHMKYNRSSKGVKETA